jgi:hypothetical protein
MLFLIQILTLTSRLTLTYPVHHPVLPSPENTNGADQKACAVQ